MQVQYLLESIYTLCMGTYVWAHTIFLQAGVFACACAHKSMRVQAYMYAYLHAFVN